MIIDKNCYLQNDSCANKNPNYKYLHHPNNENYQIIYPNPPGIYLFKAMKIPDQCMKYIQSS